MKSAATRDGTLRPYTRIVSTAQRLFDVGIIVVARYVACTLYPKAWDNQDSGAALIAVALYIITAEINQVYRSWRAAPLREQLKAVFWSWGLVAVPMLLVAFAFKVSAEQSRLINGMWFLFATVGLGVLRAFTKLLLVYTRRHGRNSRVAGIVGATRVGFRLAEHLNEPATGTRLHGIYDDRSPDRIEGYLGTETLAGTIEQAIIDAREGRLDVIYLALPLRAQARVSEIVAQLADTTADVQMAADFSVFELLHARWGAVGDIPTVSLFDTPFQGVAGWAKRLEDIVLGSLLLLAASPVMLLIAVLIKATTRGPVFFVQTRYGLNGKAIKVLKFRSMTTADDGKVVRQAQRNDARVTKVGAILRATSLDELPQFFNVVRGDMSIVGPRPHAVAHNEEYRSLIHGYMLRHKVKPGITGWAQVNGLRGETDTLEKMKKRVEYDLEYIENWRLSWDLEIIFLTAFRAWNDKSAF
jgi:putative colanic acid biosysnthesis UDP-glucose lipid carrier transferase